MNPQHTIPTLNDGGFYLNESRGIATYLVSKYGKNDNLYPKDVAIRAIVDARLYFDMGVFYKAMGDIVVCKRYKNCLIKVYTRYQIIY